MLMFLILQGEWKPLARGRHAQRQMEGVSVKGISVKGISVKGISVNIECGKAFL